MIGAIPPSHICLHGVHAEDVALNFYEISLTVNKSGVVWKQVPIT
jgi:hypothetical protein